LRRFNLNQPNLEVDPGEPAPYGAGTDRFGKEIGASRLGGTVYELKPGQSVCPYHYEITEEEWCIALSGRPTVRHPDGEDELAEGDVVCFPRGETGAHKITNRGTETIRVLMISEVVDPALTVYPDSGKVGVYAGDDRFLVRRSDAVDYFDGEPTDN